MIGENIRKLRERKGYTQNSLGDILNLSPSTIGMYEQDRRLPDVETLIKMCKLFDVSSDYLLEMTENPTPYKKNRSGDDFHKRLKNLMKDKQMNESTIAEMTKIRKSRLGDILSGKYPNINELKLLAECFWESTDYILCMTDEHQPHEQLHIDSPSFQSRLAMLMDGYSELEISNELDISILKLRNYISGEDIPDAKMLKKMSDFFKVSTDYLLGLRQKTRESFLDGHFPYSADDVCINRIQSILNSDSDEHLAYSLGLTIDELFALYHYGFIPHIAVIIKLCKMGNVSPDYLLGFSESPLSIKKNDTADEDSLIRGYRKLSTHYKKKIEGALSEQILQQERDNFMKESVAADTPSKTGTDNMGK